MRYFVGGTKGFDKFYHGKNRYWIYSIGLVSAFFLNVIIFKEELNLAIIKDLVWMCALYILMEFVFYPKSFLYVDFQIDRLELGFFRGKDNKTIKHSNIKSIDTNISDIIIITKDGMNYEIPLSNFHFDEVKGIKVEVKKIEDKLVDSYQLLAT